MDPNGPLWCRECQNPVRSKVGHFDQNGRLTILDHLGPVHLPAVLRPLLKQFRLEGHSDSDSFPIADTEACRHFHHNFIFL